MKVYIAGRYSRRDSFRELRDELRRMGHEVTSRWLDTDWPVEERGSSAAPPEYREKYATLDLEDVEAADMVVSFTEEPRSGGRGGRHVEYGYALALRRMAFTVYRGNPPSPVRIVVIGQRENLFHHHPFVEFFPSQWDWLRSLESVPGPADEGKGADRG
jgi:nucleoside 2-deoxyribosyltransferase